MSQRGIKIAYPRVVAARQLAFHWVESAEELSAGVWGIAEPVAKTPVVAIGSIDAIVVPGLAFDMAGRRLGWGRGYYDSALAEHGDALRIGFGYECQVVNKVPAANADAPMDLLVTEGRAMVCSAGRLSPKASS